MQKKTFFTLLITITLLFLVFSSCVKKESKTTTTGEFDIAVFVPGVVDGSPTYEMMVQGVQKAAAESSTATVKVVEGGFNQGEWKEKIMNLAAAGKFEVIISSNPAMPEICAEVAQAFPSQKFILLDGYLEGNPNIYTFRYNQKEQGFLIGYFGALISSSNMSGTEDGVKIGLIAAQEYPDMNLSIRPGFEEGVKSLSPEAKIDFRVIGNWYDAAKAAEIANSMFDSGVDVILTISGGAAAGVLKAAEDREKYVLWFDSNAYANNPGVIIGCTGISQIDVAYEKTLAAINGELAYGEADFEGIAENRVSFITDDPIFKETVPSEIINAIIQKQQEFSNGEINFPMVTN